MDRVKDYFQQVAGRWDEMRQGYFTEAVREAAIARANLRPEMAVADVGAGTGFMAQGLAPLVRKVYAFDASEEMLAVARRNLEGFQNVEFRVAEGRSLPLEEASVDAVFANMYLHHAPDPLAAIAEMARLLKPGGRLVITDCDRHDYTWMQEEMSDLWPGFEREQVRAWYEQAGLVNVIVEDSEQRCCGASACGGEAQVSIFVAAGTKPNLAVKEKVAESYQAVARRGSSATSCCGSPSSESSSGLQPGKSCCTGPYAPEELVAIPGEAAEMSMGCGNPVALAGLCPGEVVLDIGSGAGIDVFLAARKVGPEGKVIGLDLLEDMLERARRTAAQAGYQNVEFRQGDAEHIPLEGDSVDVVISNCVINLAMDKGNAFREAYRVLKEGGRLCISDIVTDSSLPEYVKNDPGTWAACVGGALTEQEYLALIAQAGFRDISVAVSEPYEGLSEVKIYSIHVTASK